MNAPYPAHLLAREAAPPYVGEGPFALWHFSEDPSDCPRGCIWSVPTTTAADRDRFFGQGRASRIHVVEADWLKQMHACRLYAYRLRTELFRPHHVGGYWVTDQEAEAIEQVVVDDLLGQHAQAAIELRITPSIWPFWRQVTSSTVGFSGSRLHNAAPEQQTRLG